MIQKARVISGTLLTVALACPFIIYLPSDWKAQSLRLEPIAPRSRCPRLTGALVCSASASDRSAALQAKQGGPEESSQRLPGLRPACSVDPTACLAANPDSILLGGSNPHGSERSAQRRRAVPFGYKLWCAGVTLSLHRLITDKAQERSDGHNHR